MYDKRQVVFLILFILFSCPGCAAVAVLPIIMSGAGAGASYSMLNTAHKTETRPIGDVYRAALRAIKTMGFGVERIREKDEVRLIQAVSEERKISVKLAIVTGKATRVTINVKEGPVIKDKATAEEIIRQMEEILENFTQDRSRKGILAVLTEPEDALVRILNIKPKFYQGIELPPGKYLIEVSAQQYKMSKTWIIINPEEDKFLQVSLEKL